MLSPPTKPVTVPGTATPAPTTSPDMTPAAKATWLATVSEFSRSKVPPARVTLEKAFAPRTVRVPALTVSAPVVLILFRLEAAVSA